MLRRDNQLQITRCHLRPTLVASILLYLSSVCYIGLMITIFSSQSLVQYELIAFFTSCDCNTRIWLARTLGCMGDTGSIHVCPDPFLSLRRGLSARLHVAVCKTILCMCSKHNQIMCQLDVHSTMWLSLSSPEREKGSNCILLPLWVVGVGPWE